MNPFSKLKTILVTGVLVVLPAWLAVLLFLKLLVKLGVLVKPVSGYLPPGINHPTLVGLLTFLLLCLFVGLLFHTVIGQAIGRTVETAIFARIPGYAALRSLAAQLGRFESEHDFQPSFIDVEEGCQTPAFLIEEHIDGRCTVLIPSVPTPMAGSLLVMDRDRVHPVDVTVREMVRCISRSNPGKATQTNLTSPPATPSSKFRIP